MRSRRRATLGALGSTLAIALGLAGVAAPAHAAGAVVPDATLTACLNAGMWPARPATTVITEAELSWITGVYCNGVADLTGLEHATSLRTAYFPDATFSSLAPLAANRTLVTLGVTAYDADLTVSIDDLSPLDDSPMLETLLLGKTASTTLPDVAGMPKLTTLGLGDTQIADLTPLTAHPALVDLSLWGSQVSDIAPLATIGTLTSLTLSNAPLSDLGPLRTMTGLSTLALDGAGVSDLDPLRTMTGLSTLTLDGTGVSDLEPLGPLSTLSRLTILDAPLSDLSPLRTLSGLTELVIDGSRVSDLSPLYELDELYYLSFVNAPVSDISGLGAMPRLSAVTGTGAAITDVSTFGWDSLGMAINDQRVTHGSVTAGVSVPNPLRGFEGAFLAPSAESLTAAGATLSEDGGSLVFAAPGTYTLSWIEEPFGAGGEGYAVFSGTIEFTVVAPVVTPPVVTPPVVTPPVVTPPVVTPPVVTPPVVTPPVVTPPVVTPAAAPQLAETGLEIAGWAVPTALLLLAAGAAVMVAVRVRRRA